MLGVETGYFNFTYSREVYKEVGWLETMQKPSWAVGFYTRFESITVRRVK